MECLSTITLFKKFIPKKRYVMLLVKTVEEFHTAGMSCRNSKIKLECTILVLLEKGAWNPNWPIKPCYNGHYLVYGIP